MWWVLSFHLLVVCLVFYGVVSLIGCGLGVCLVDFCGRLVVFAYCGFVGFVGLVWFLLDGGFWDVWLVFVVVFMVVSLLV